MSDTCALNKGAVTLNQTLGRNYRVWDCGMIVGEEWNGVVKIAGWLKVSFCRN